MSTPSSINFFLGDRKLGDQSMKRPYGQYAGPTGPHELKMGPFCRKMPQNRVFGGGNSYTWPKLIHKPGYKTDALEQT